MCTILKYLLVLTCIYMPQYFAESGKLVTKLFGHIEDLTSEGTTFVYILIDEVVYDMYMYMYMLVYKSYSVIYVACMCYR